MQRLAGKTALITGAARGIGAAIAERFVDEGAAVIVNDLSLEAARATAERLGGHGVAADVSDSGSVAKMFRTIGELTPRLDILVNNAGIGGMEGRNDVDERVARFAERARKAAAGELTDEDYDDATVQITDEEWRRMMAVHVDGTFYCSREALKLMNAAKRGVILNMSSIIGTFGRSGPTGYAAAKAAILGFTRALAHEVVTRNIRVNAIAPGWISTDMTAHIGPMKPFIEAQIPMGRFGDPDDIAWAAVYLCSDEAKYVTGQVVSPNGGWYMSQ